MADSHAQLFFKLQQFVRDEQTMGLRKLQDIWDRPIADKLHQGWCQRIVRLERAEEPACLWAVLGGGESRFREGDTLILHGGHPWRDQFGRGLRLEAEQNGRWLLHSRHAQGVIQNGAGCICFADPDTMDLTSFYEGALEDIWTSPIGRDIVLPLLCGDIEPGFVPADVEHGERVARDRGFNPRQAEAVGLAYGAEQLACIHVPPGTGKSSVLALIARLMVERGERVLVTSHTHTAINNALNKIAGEGVPVVKIGEPAQRKGLDDGVPRHRSFAEWDERPRGGWVIGATPFATCTYRLEACEFDAVLFDEASQITVPLALMAMRSGRRFVFVGDQQQLPPVMLSRSVLDEESMSAFAALTSKHADHTVMLDETYRMNRWLAAWPSDTYYGGRLRAAGANRERCLALGDVPQRFQAAFDPAAPGVFIPCGDRLARTRNVREADLVVQLCAAAVSAGLAPQQIAIVTPYRAQGRAVRGRLRAALGDAAARRVVADTVERMQGQERELIIVSLASGDPAFLAAVAGFFFQPQRLNVAITRAKSKLIVIGPDIPSLPTAEHDEIRRWIGQYADLLRHLKRVALQDPKHADGHVHP
jgi:DNA replication ATP-dependent helicase Dna2